MGRTSYQSVYCRPGTVVSCSIQLIQEAALECNCKLTPSTPTYPSSPLPWVVFLYILKLIVSMPPPGWPVPQEAARARGLQAETRVNRCSPRPGAAELPAAGAGAAPRTGQRLALARPLSRGEKRAGTQAASFFTPPDIPASSAPGAPDAAYSAAGFEVWATARLGPGSQGARMAGGSPKSPLSPDTRETWPHPIPRPGSPKP